MGAALTRDEDEITAVWTEACGDVLARRWAEAEERRGGRADAVAVLRATTLEELQDACFARLPPSAGEIIAASLGGAPSLAFEHYSPARTLWTEYDTDGSEGDEGADALGGDAREWALEQFADSELAHWGDVAHARGFARALEAGWRRAAAAARGGGDAAGGGGARTPVSPELFVPLALRSLSGRAREAQLCAPCTAPGALAGPVVSFPGGAPDARSPGEAGLGKALLMGGV